VTDHNSSRHQQDPRELAEEYLDFWQRNLAAWAVDMKLYDAWAGTLAAGLPEATKRARDDG